MAVAQWIVAELEMSCATRPSRLSRARSRRVSCIAPRRGDDEGMEEGAKRGGS